MCRHLAYLGPPASIRAVLVDPPYGLARQAWAPRRQRYGTMNVDGFGVGWYAALDPVPARYRRAGPMWADPSFADLARVTRTRALLAAVRSATEGTEPGAAAAAPYTAGRWLFSHNGRLDGWPAATARLAATLPAADLLTLEARCDSALAWALVSASLLAGAAPADALAAAVATLAGHGIAGRFNFLLTDGEVIAATAAGDTLCYRSGGGSVTVASEPGDDEPGWVEVSDHSLLTATCDGAEVRPLSRAAGTDGNGAPPRTSGPPAHDTEERTAIP
jgi:gamma-glutamyl hercynylcysteine S-oxide hydrolase